MATLYNDPRRKEEIDDEFFKSIDSEEKAYFLGLLAADGCVSKDRNRITLTLHEQDVKVLQRFAKLINTSVKTYPNNATMRTVVFTSKQIKQNLIELGVTPLKAKTLCMPNIPKEFLIHFVRGYFDGDGSVNQYNVYFSSSSKKLIEELELFFSDIPTFKYQQKDTNVWYLKGKGKLGRTMILEALYKDSNIFMQRKYNKAIETHKLAPLEGKPLVQTAEKTVNPETDTNQCKKCNEVKPYSSFVKKKGMKTGYANTCKACQNQYQAKFRIGNAT